MVDHFGDPLPSNPTRHAFPTPQQILLGDNILREAFPSNIARKLIRVAEKFSSKVKRIEGLTQEECPADALAAKLAKLLNLGPETMGLVMLSLGRYDYIPATLRLQQHTRLSNKGHRNIMRDAQAMFEPLQPWGGLACWLWDWSSADTAEANALAGGT